MKIYVTSVFVNDQRNAMKFYTEKLGFEKKHDIPVGKNSWLTVTAKGERNGTLARAERSSSSRAVSRCPRC